MGRFVFKLPDVGEGIAEAEVVGWHVASSRGNVASSFSTSSTRSSAPTRTLSPGPPVIARTRPARGEGISTVRISEFFRIGLHDHRLEINAVEISKTGNGLDPRLRTSTLLCARFIAPTARGGWVRGSSPPRLSLAR